MTEQEIFEQLHGVIREVLGKKVGAISMDSRLIYDLGAESIDLLDITFMIEERFGVIIEPNGFEKEVKKRLSDGIFERDGFLTEGALAELRRALPEVDQSRLVPGLRKAEIPALLTVAVFVHLIMRHQAADTNHTPS